MAKVPKPKIVWKGAHPNNFTVGRPNGSRNGQKTDHHVVGSADSAVLVFNNPSRGASSHFIVTAVPDLIYQCVNLKDTAWTDSNWASNLRAITVEHHGDWRFGYNNATVRENAAKLTAWLRDQGLINHVIRHRQVSRTGTICPADFPVEAVWDRATQIINKYKNQNNKPQWLKDRKTLNTKVYSHKDGLFLRDLTNPNRAVDSRRWGVNQVFDIGSYTTIKGVRYYITRSSTGTNTPAGLREGEVKREKYVAPKPPVTLVSTDKFKPAKKLEFNQDTVLVDIPANTKAKASGKLDYKKGEVLENIAELRRYSDGKRFYRTQFSVDNNIMRGFGASKLTEVVPKTEPPKPPEKEVPEWVDEIQEEPKRTMYVLRATPLIDLEDGHPYTNPDTGKEVWFEAGDIIENLVAHVVIEDDTYRLTEFAYGQTKSGKWKLFANGINSDDLTTDPMATPIGTPANPEEPADPKNPPEDMPDVPDEPIVDQPSNPPSSGSEYLDELQKNNSLLQTILDAINKILEWLKIK